MSRVLSHIHSFLLEQKKPFVFCIAVLLVALVGYLDYATGFEISLFFFYLVPIALATWYVNSIAGHLMVFVSVTTWLISDGAAGQTYSQEVIRYWNAFSRMSVFVLIVWLLQEFRRALTHERMLSQTDHLTGIANRREFYQKLKEELVRAARSDSPLSVAYIDLDGFKEVNDLFGHRAGDQLLRAVAQSFQSTVRETDLVGRLGGDEFAILFPNTGPEGAHCIMQRVRSAFLQHMNQLKSNVTFSAGVVSYTTAPSSMEHILFQADALMYQVKKQGKNDIAFHTIAVTSGPESFEILNDAPKSERLPPGL